MTRYDQMLARFKEFDQQHPIFWEYFKRFTFELIARGFKNHSAVAVTQRIRWETDQAEYEPGKTFKVNNDHIPFYARKFMAFYPAYDGFFRTREQKSKGRAAETLPPLTPSDFPYTDESHGQFKLNL